jgi:Fic-DOC domain mobile mystery protein B
MGLNLEYSNGQTPIDEDEKEGLLISTITTRSELDEFEQLNIQEAQEWIRKRKFTKEKILTEQFVKELHRRMYSDVWNWAGEFRTTNKNIGVDKYEIGIRLKNLLDDCVYWIEHKTYLDDEIAIRFKHRLVSIHCFSNGNGRHSRLMAEIIIKYIFGKPIFTWHSTNLTTRDDPRKEYFAALKEADAGNILPLVEFARM